MNKITMTLRYSLLQFLIWGIYGIVIGFSASYFLDCGLSDAGYGLALGIASALAFLAQLAMGELISRLPKLTIHIAVRILTCAMALCGGALLMIKLSAVRILLFALILVLMQVIPGLLNALGMAAARQALKVNFGIARGVGSMSYALFSFLTGQAIVLVGQGAVPGLTAALSVLLFCGLWLFPNVGCGSKDTVEKDRMGRPLCRDLLFLALLICTTLLFVSNNLMVNFLLQLVRSRGGNEAGVGIAAAISAMAELPTMFLFGWMLRKLRCDSWLKISAICMTVKSVICLLATHLGVLYAVQLMQAVGYGLLYVASVHYVDAVVSRENLVRAQAMLAATLTLATLLSSFFGGLILEGFGIQAVLGGSAVCAAAAAVIFLLTLKKVDPGTTGQIAVQPELRGDSHD